jgi:hypothetical protein
MIRNKTVIATIIKPRVLITPAVCALIVKLSIIAENPLKLGLSVSSLGALQERSSS